MYMYCYIIYIADCHQSFLNEVANLVEAVTCLNMDHKTMRTTQHQSLYNMIEVGTDVTLFKTLHAW